MAEGRLDFTDAGIDAESGLTLRERAAVDHYIISLNKTKAYQLAGYAAETYANARKDANEFFNKPHIHSYLGERLKERAERLQVSADGVLIQLCLIAYSRITDFIIDPTTGGVCVRPGIPQEAIAAVRSVKSTQVTRIVSRVRRGGIQESETIITWTGEITLWDKMKAAQLLCLHLGLIANKLPPLEVLLNRLPANVASIFRRLLAGPDPDERERLRQQRQETAGVGGQPPT